jgi:putative hydrolase of the HAD superfamily
VSLFQAVIFDFFGTLTHAVQRGPTHDRIARSLGCSPPDFARELNATFAQRSVGGLGHPSAALAEVAARVGSHPRARHLRNAASDRVAALAADTRLRSDAVSVLARFRRLGLKTGLISDCGPELPEILPHLPIAPLLDTMVLSVDTGLRKPDPEIYLLACDRLSVPPSQCLYVGDGGSRELTGATAVGMAAIRLDAPDLGRHLVFDQDSEWDGPRAPSLQRLLIGRTPTRLAS